MRIGSQGRLGSVAISHLQIRHPGQATIQFKTESLRTTALTEKIQHEDRSRQGQAGGIKSAFLHFGFSSGSQWMMLTHHGESSLLH